MSVAYAIVFVRVCPNVLSPVTRKSCASSRGPVDVLCDVNGGREVPICVRCDCAYLHLSTGGWGFCGVPPKAKVLRSRFHVCGRLVDFCDVDGTDGEIRAALL
jgi:hypothetical protein